jgi:catechol 2,3-dioxygenase-like lactoylglutathione lyase family enzyme
LLECSITETEEMRPRIQHVSVPVPPDSAASVRSFYGDLLLLAEMPVPPALSSLDLVWFQLGDTELHLFAEETHADRSARHFCIAVDDVHALKTRLESAGVAVVGATPIPGRPRYFCRDPFGNLIEITTIESEQPQHDFSAADSTIRTDQI